MSKRIQISADSTCDLDTELLQKYQIKTIPLYITFGENAYRDGIEITPDALYEKVEKEGVMAKTSAVSIGDFTEYFAGLLKEADEVIHFPLSSELSCTCQNAILAAQEFEGRVHVVDTKNLSTGEALTIIYAATLVEKGMSSEEIVAQCNEYVKRVDASFIIEKLDYLHKGGRCSALTVLGANMLSIKPCIQVKNGKMDVGKKYRGKFLAVIKNYIKEQLAGGDFETDRIFVTHAGCADEVVKAAYEEVLNTGLFSEVLLTRAGCTISAHCGADTLGILFVRKHEI